VVGAKAPALREAHQITEEGRGDLYVTIQVVTPTVHDQRSQELLRELARLNPENPRKDLTGGVPGTQGVAQ
jgi:DnaJ-class molecular chaperone